jgi:fibrillarin-like rRNA methylase
MVRITTLPTMPGVYSSMLDNHIQLFTRNLCPGISVYGESLNKVGGQEYRSWDPNRSKLGAAIINLPNQKPPNVFPQGCHVLYLGAAHGTTISHISDIIGPNGVIYALEFSDTTFTSLVALAEHRSNIIPLLQDVRYPSQYAFLVGSVDVIYSDVSQPDQSQIVLNNMTHFLRPKGWLMMAMKLSSIAYQKDYSTLIAAERRRLSSGFQILHEIPLDPFHKKHVFFIGKALNNPAH